MSRLGDRDGFRSLCGVPATVASAFRTSLPSERSRVVVVDDHPLLVEGLIKTLAEDPRLELVGQAASAKEAFGLVEKLRPEVVVADLVLGGAGPQARGDGLKLIADLHRLDAQLRIVAVSFVEDVEHAARALAAGASAYVSKAEATANLLTAVHTVLAGGVYKSPFIFSTASRLTAGTNAVVGQAKRRLTNRELQILHAIGLGHANRRIAADFGLSVKTVESHKESLKDKFGFADMAALAELARRFAASL